jgi:hypothetical protein
MREGSTNGTTGRQLCAYCHTELSADALVCEACGMSQTVLTAPAPKPPPVVPAPSALTGPALRPPPDPPALTAPALQPPPAPPAPAAPSVPQLSENGRAAAVRGDIKAATASRAKLLRDLERLNADATDKQLKAAVASFIPAITEALRQNRECGSRCSTAELDKVGALKHAALQKLNPLLKAHGGDTYRPEDI